MPVDLKKLTELLNGVDANLGKGPPQTSALDASAQWYDQPLNIAVWGIFNGLAIFSNLARIHMAAAEDIRRIANWMESGGEELSGAEHNARKYAPTGKKVVEMPGRAEIIKEPYTMMLYERTPYELQALRNFFGKDIPAADNVSLMGDGFYHCPTCSKAEDMRVDDFITHVAHHRAQTSQEDSYKLAGALPNTPPISEPATEPFHTGGFLANSKSRDGLPSDWTDALNELSPPIGAKSCNFPACDCEIFCVHNTQPVSERKHQYARLSPMDRPGPCRYPKCICIAKCPDLMDGHNAYPV